MMLDECMRALMMKREELTRHLLQSKLTVQQIQREMLKAALHRAAKIFDKQADEYRDEGMPGEEEALRSAAEQLRGEV